MIVWGIREKGIVPLVLIALQSLHEAPINPIGLSQGHRNPKNSSNSPSSICKSWSCGPFPAFIIQFSSVVHLSLPPLFIAIRIDHLLPKDVLIQLCQHHWETLSWLQACFTFHRSWQCHCSNVLLSAVCKAYPQTWKMLRFLNCEKMELWGQLCNTRSKLTVCGQQSWYIYVEQRRAFLASDGIIR